MARCAGALLHKAVLSHAQFPPYTLHGAAAMQPWGTRIASADQQASLGSSIQIRRDAWGACSSASLGQSGNKVTVVTKRMPLSRY